MSTDPQGSSSSIADDDSQANSSQLSAMDSSASLDQSLPSSSDASLYPDPSNSQLRTNGVSRMIGSSLAVLQQAWVSERACPELLNYETAAVSDLQQRIKERQGDLDLLADSPTDSNMVLTLYQMDLDRATYILAAYLRTRLKKIERFASFIMQSDALEEKDRLSPQEQEYAKDYFELLGSHLSSAFLDHLPKRFQQLNDKGMVETPKLKGT